MSERVLEVRGLSTWLRSSGSTVRAVDGLDFSISRGETFALLGESGCGKSMTALSIMRLLPDAGRVVAGTVQLSGTDLLRLPEVAMQAVRGRRAAMIFQEPGSSLGTVRGRGPLPMTRTRHNLAARPPILSLILHAHTPAPSAPEHPTRPQPKAYPGDDVLDEPAKEVPSQLVPAAVIH